MNMTLSIITLVILVAGIGLLIAAMGCDRLASALDALKRSSSARVTSAILGAALIAGTAGTQLQIIELMSRARPAPAVVSPTAVPQVVLAPTTQLILASTAVPQPQKSRAKPTPTDPDLQQPPSMIDLRR